MPTSSKTGTATLHKVIKTSPEKLFKAFTNAEAMAAWLPPYGFVGVVHELNAKTGGTFKMSFINFSTGKKETFGGEFIEFKPGELLKYTDRFDNPGMPGEITTTVTFKKVMGGTDLTVVQEGIPAVIPVEMCYLGWQESLEKLTRLVEPEIPDA